MRFTVASRRHAWFFPPSSQRRLSRVPRSTPNQQLAHDIYKELVEINTVDSVGSTTVAANAIAKRFRRRRVSGERHLPGRSARPTRATSSFAITAAARASRCCCSRISTSSQALKSDWSPDLDPFVFTERDGYYYGRGTGDDKAMASIFVANLLRFKKEKYVPDRDIILALTADEEGGGSNGVRWLLANHKDLIDAAYALNEGGGGALRDGKPFINSVGAAEKVSANFTVSTANRGGHSSVPRDDNAIYQLAQALTHVGDVSVSGDAQRRDQGVLHADRRDRDAGDGRRDARDRRESERRGGLGDDRRAIRATARCCARRASRRCSPVGMRATRCRRRRRRTSIAAWRPATIRRTCAPALMKAVGDTGVSVSRGPAMEHAAPSPLSPEVMGPIEKVTRDVFGPGVAVIPTMGTGATDSKYLRAVGHSRLWRVRPVRRPERQPRARKGRARADQVVLRQPGIPVSAREGDVVGKVGSVSRAAARVALDVAILDDRRGARRAACGPAAPPSADTGATRRVTSPAIVHVAPSVRLHYLDFGGHGPGDRLPGRPRQHGARVRRLRAELHRSVSCRRADAARVRRIAIIPTTGYDTPRLVDDIRAAIDTLALGRVILIGHSIAGEEMTRFAGDISGSRRRSSCISTRRTIASPPTRCSRRSSRCRPTFRRGRKPTAADTATPAAYVAFVHRTRGVNIPEADIRTRYRYDGWNEEITPAYQSMTVEHPPYRAVRAPALAIYAVTDAISQLEPAPYQP